MSLVGHRKLYRDSVKTSYIQRVSYASSASFKNIFKNGIEETERRGGIMVLYKNWDGQNSYDTFAIYLSLSSNVNRSSCLNVLIVN